MATIGSGTLCGLAVAGCLLVGSSAFGVIIDGNGTGSDPGTGTNNTSAASYPVAGMKNVGTFAGGAGVYIGNGWVLAAYHEATTQYGTPNAKPLTFYDGSTFYNDGVYHQLTAGSNTADLVMVHLSSIPNPSSFPALTISTSTPSINTTIYDIGDGLTRGTATSYNGNSGWTEVSPQVMRWGQNVTVNTNKIPGNSTPGTTINVNDGFGITSMFVSSFGSNLTQISTGDSGGGVFGSNNTLLGINLVAFGNDSSQPANTAIFGNASGYADLSVYASQISTYYSTPEPGSLGVLAIGAAGLLVRRRRLA